MSFYPRSTTRFFFVQEKFLAKLKFVKRMFKLLAKCATNLLQVVIVLKIKN